MPKTFPFSQKLSNYCFLNCPHTHWKSCVEALESELEWIRGARFYKGWRKCNVNASDREELPVPSSWNLVYVFVCFFLLRRTYCLYALPHSSLLSLCRKSLVFTCGLYLSSSKSSFSVNTKFFNADIGGTLPSVLSHSQPAQPFLPSQTLNPRHHLSIPSGIVSFSALCFPHPFHHASSSPFGSLFQLVFVAR